MFPQLLFVCKKINILLGYMLKFLDLGRLVMAEQICPHCREEFNDNDLKKFRLRLDFEENHRAELKRMHRFKKFFTSGWQVLFVVIIAIFLNNSLWALVGISLILFGMIYAPYISEKKETALFNRYKNEINA